MCCRHGLRYYSHSPGKIDLDGFINLSSQLTYSSLLTSICASASIKSETHPKQNKTNKNNNKINSTLVPCSFNYAPADYAADDATHLCLVSLDFVFGRNWVPTQELQIFICRRAGSLSF